VVATSASARIALVFGHDPPELLARLQVDALFVEQSSARHDIRFGYLRVLQGRDEIRLRCLDRNAVRFRIDPEQDLPLGHVRIFLRADRNDLAGHLRRKLDQERVNARVRRIGREAIGKHAVSEDDEKQDDRNQQDLACAFRLFRCRGAGLGFRHCRTLADAWTQSPPSAR
jgi:hypothetical protein